MQSRFIRILAKLGISVFAIVLILASLEAFFRVFNPQSEYAVVLAPWGFTHKPNAKIHYRWRNHWVPIHYNSKGLRGPEVPFEKPPGVFRILVLGDSWVEDMGSFYENLFTTRLERKLNRLYRSPRFEVINGGHFAFDHAQELMFYLKEGRKYHPDLVVVLYALDKADSRLVALENGRLVFHYYETFSRAQRISRSGITWIRTHSHFGSFLLNRIQAMSLGARLASFFYGRYPGEGTNGKAEPPRTPVAVFPSDHPNVAGLPRNVQEELRRKGIIQDEVGYRSEVDWHIWSRFKQEVEKDGARLVIFQVWPDSVFRFRENLPPLHIPAFNLKRIPGRGFALYQEAVKAGTYDPRLDSHRWGYGGNAEAAEQILGSLTGAGLLPPRSGR